MRSFLLVVGFIAVPLASACSAFTGVDPTGLVASGDAGSDSNDGRSTRDGGSSHDSGSKKDSGGLVSPSLGPDCTSLQSCCDFLDTSSAASCRTTALDANESSCSANLSAYQDDGYCQDVSPPPPVDSGTVTPPPPVDSGLPLTGNCAALIGCCSAVGADTSCLTTVLAGDDTACENLYFTYILDGVTCS